MHCEFIFLIMLILQLWSYSVLTWWHTWKKENIGGKKKKKYFRWGRSSVKTCFDNYLHRYQKLYGDRLRAKSAEPLLWVKSIAVFCQCEHRFWVVFGEKPLLFSLLVNSGELVAGKKIPLGFTFCCCCLFDWFYCTFPYYFHLCQFGGDCVVFRCGHSNLK